MRRVPDVPELSDGVAKLGMRDFIKYLVGNSGHFTANYDAIERASRVLEQLPQLMFDEALWDLLCAAAKNPTCPYPTKPAHESKRFVDGLLSAEMVTTKKV